MNREYRPRICCWHMWVSESKTDRRERCATCGATCTRNGAGQIVDYAAKAGGES